MTFNLEEAESKFLARQHQQAWINSRGKISGNQFGWYLIQEHKELLESLLDSYLKFVPEPFEGTVNELYKQGSWISSGTKLRKAMNSNKMIKVSFTWEGKLYIHSVQQIMSCPLKGFTLDGEKLPITDGQHINSWLTFFMYQNKKYYRGDTSVCAMCKNSLNCATVGKPAEFSYFESIEEKPKRNARKRS